ncbi:MAG TPA: EamA family transporter RarD [Vicinamibacteria bacterium]
MRYSAVMAAQPRTTSPPTSDRARGTGLVFGLGAYAIWGVLPIYFKRVAAAPPVELLAHRVLWALVLLLALSWQQGLLGELREALRPGRTLAFLAATTVLIAVNWLVYIWAVVHGRIMEGSLGYFINPLVNVLLGVVVLKERLERPVLAAVLVAAAGVAWLTLQVGHPPWISLTLAASFGLYGLLRKLVPVGAVAGLTVETLLLSPLAAGYLLWARSAGRLAFGGGRAGLDVLLVLAGPITAVPLLLFTGAARRLPLTTLGILQYLSPTLQLLVAIFLYGEPFTAARGVAFACIWTALLIFAAHSLVRGGSATTPRAAP